MKVVVVCTSTKVFGAETATLALLRGLKRRGHTVLAVTSSWTDGVFSRHLVAAGVREIQMPIGVLSKKLTPQAMWWTLNALVRAPKMWWIWARTLRAFAPDAVILTNPKQGLWLYPWLSRQRTYFVDHALKAVSWANRWMYGRLARRVQFFIAVSKFLADHIASLGVPSERIRVIYNSVPEAAPSWPTATGEKSATVVGIVGQIAAHKGHDILAHAVASMAARGIQIEVRAFGTGPMEFIAGIDAQLAAAAVTNRWRWMSYVSDPAAIYRQINILAVPSRCEESFGMVAAEAGSFGIPVVAARRGALPEVVQDRVSGLLFRAEDPDDLAEKIAELVKNPAFAKKLGERGRDLVRRQFSEDAMITEYERLFAV